MTREQHAILQAWFPRLTEISRHSVLHTYGTDALLPFAEAGTRPEIALWRLSEGEEGMEPVNYDASPGDVVLLYHTRTTDNPIAFLVSHTWSSGVRLMGEGEGDTGMLLTYDYARLVEVQAVYAWRRPKAKMQAQGGITGGLL